MMKRHFLLIALLSLTALSAADDISVKLAGMQVVWDDGAEFFDGFKTLNSTPGINCSLLVSTTGDRFVSLDSDESKLTIGGEKANCWFFGGNSISKDSKHLRVKLDAEGAKSADGKVELKGELVLTTAKEKGVISTEIIEWKKGSVVKFPKETGIPTFTVDEVGKPKWGNDKWEVTLKTNKDFEKFVKVMFVDEKGKEMKATRGGWSRMGMFGKVKVSVSYKLKLPVTRAKMVVEYWKGIKKVKVPVQMTIGMEGSTK